LRNLLVGLALVLPLQGCFFLFIPGSVVNAATDAVTGAEGDHCVSEFAKVGDTISDPATSRTATIKSLSGRSTRCTQDGKPIRAKLTFN